MSSAGVVSSVGGSGPSVYLYPHSKTSIMSGNPQCFTETSNTVYQSRIVECGLTDECFLLIINNSARHTLETKAEKNVAAKLC